MASKTIEWIIPSTLLTNTSYTIDVYKSTVGENGDYSLVDTISAGSSNSTYTYVDANGDDAYYYYVRYTPSGGTAGSIVLARIQPTVRELRLRDKVYSILPEVIQARIDANRTQIRDSIKNALNMVNAYAPVTSYTITSMPGAYETAVEFGSQMLLYLEHILQISIRDFGYGVSGIALNIDRGAKINQALTLLTNHWNNYLKVAKFRDYPDGIGLGSLALATPSARVWGMLYDSVR